MTPEEKRLLDGGILLQLEAAYPHSLTPRVLHLNLRVANGFHSLDEPTLNERLRLLESQHLVERQPDDVIRAYLLADEGRTWLVEKGFLR